MSEQVMAVYSRYLTEFGALAPVKLGGKTVKSELPSAEDVARFLVAVEGCQRSTKRVQTLMLLAYFAILLAILGLLIYVSLHGASVLLTAVLGGTGAASLTILPVRMQASWKELTLMQLTLAMLPGRPVADQVVMMKSLFLGASGTAAS